MKEEQYATDEPGGCPAATTRGMLMRWFYGQEPGRGFTLETLAEHIEICSVCNDEVKEIAEQDQLLQARFSQEVLANTRMVEAIQARRTVARVRTQLSAAVGEEGSEEAAIAAMDLIAVMRSEDPPAKIRGLVEALQHRRKIQDMESRRASLRDLSMIATKGKEVNSGELNAALKARSDQPKSYPIADPKTLALVIQLLMDVDAHAVARSPILKLSQENVVIDWTAWLEAGDLIKCHGQ